MKRTFAIETYEELAAILDGDKVYGFLLFNNYTNKLKGELDPRISLVQSGGVTPINEIMELAAKRDIDSLRVENSELVPAPREETLLDGLLENFTEKMENHPKTMSMEKLIDNDCLFQKRDVDIMMADKTVILASVRHILETENGKALLVINFYSAYVGSANRLRGYLMDDGIYRGGDDYGNFMTQCITLDNLLKLQKTCPLNILYNMDTFSTMRTRMESASYSFPLPLNVVLRCSTPKDTTIWNVRKALEEVNRRTMKKKKRREE